MKKLTLEKVQIIRPKMLKLYEKKLFYTFRLNHFVKNEKTIQEYTKQSREDNKEHYKEYYKAYYQDNKQRLREHAK